MIRMNMVCFKIGKQGGMTIIVHQDQVWMTGIVHQDQVRMTDIVHQKVTQMRG